MAKFKNRPIDYLVFTAYFVALALVWGSSLSFFWAAGADTLLTLVWFGLFALVHLKEIKQAQDEKDSQYFRCKNRLF